MIRALIASALVLFSIFPGVAAAQSPLSDTRTIYEQGIDFVGTDLSQIFDTTRPACEAACLNTAGCCLLYTSPSPRDATLSRMPSSA